MKFQTFSTFYTSCVSFEKTDAKEFTKNLLDDLIWKWRNIKTWIPIHLFVVFIYIVEIRYWRLHYSSEIDDGIIHVGLIRFSASAIISIQLQQQSFTRLSGTSPPQNTQYLHLINCVFLNESAVKMYFPSDCWMFCSTWQLHAMLIGKHCG